MTKGVTKQRHPPLKILQKSFRKCFFLLKSRERKLSPPGGDNFCRGLRIPCFRFEIFFISFFFRTYVSQVTCGYRCRGGDFVTLRKINKIFSFQEKTFFKIKYFPEKYLEGDKKMSTPPLSFSPEFERKKTS